jgi:uncharacterized membrane protein YphA (DoxX/SURF4 family)
MADRASGTSWIQLFARLSLASAFLSAVADRVGLWGSYGAKGVAWGDFAHFLAYTERLNPWLSVNVIPALGAGVTALEVLLGILLLIGYRLRLAAAISGALLFGFAIGMILGDGLKAPLDASVFSASAAALLLMLQPNYRWSLDARRHARGGLSESPG